METARHCMKTGNAFTNLRNIRLGERERERERERENDFRVYPLTVRVSTHSVTHN